MKVLQFPDIPVFGDPQLNNVKLSYCAEILDPDLVARLQEEYRQAYVRMLIDEVDVGLSWFTKILDEEEKNELIVDYMRSPKAGIRGVKKNEVNPDQVVNAFPAQSYFTLSGGSEPTKDSLTEKEEVAAVLKTFEMMAIYEFYSHSNRGEAMVYIGGVSSTRVYTEVATSKYAQEGPFTFEVLRNDDPDLPPRLSARFKDKLVH